MKSVFRLSALVALPLLLVACDENDNRVGDGDGDDGGGVTTPQSQFGSTFETAFNADLNAEPIDPQPGDLPPVDLTADPIDF